MVRAILNGSKSQTRRIMKPQPGDNLRRGDFPNKESIGWVSDLRHKYGPTTAHFCPYGQPGDRLWGRECFYIDRYGFEAGDGPLPKDEPHHIEDDLYYRADGDCCAQIAECACAEVGKPRWRPGIHMPRWASRILVEITDVRVERLQDISEEDAIAEGIERCPIEGWRNYLWHGDPEARDRSVNGWPHQFSNYLEGRGSYSSLWERINGPGSWDANPWVWVVGFKRVRP